MGLCQKKKECDSGDPIPAFALTHPASLLARRIHLTTLISHRNKFTTVEMTVDEIVVQPRGFYRLYHYTNKRT